MAKGASNAGPPAFDPVIELLKGGDPGALAQRAGISVDELLKRKALYQRIQAQRAMEDDVVFRKIGRNDPCPCGSGKKYKKCCMSKHQEVLSRMDPEEIRTRTKKEREKRAREERVQEGYALLTQRQYERARSTALNCLELYPEDDRFHDIRATAALYLGDFEEAIEVTGSRLEASRKEKAFYAAHGRHSYDDDNAPLAHSYSPQAWLERVWVANKANEYQQNYPKKPDPDISRLVNALQGADDARRFPQQRDEGLQRRKEALKDPIEALKNAGPAALPYLLPLTVRYSWTALLIPDILLHWQDEASLKALVDIALFTYPYLSESCLKSLEAAGENALPHLKEAFERDREFDVLKIGLISVAGRIGTLEALEWATALLEHPEPTVVNWAGGVIGKAGHVTALGKLREANSRIGPEPRLEEAIENLERIS